MIIIPISLNSANQFVINNHRHHSKVAGCKFCIGISINSNIVGVAICGRPISRKFDDGFTLEVTRLCTSNEIKNGCSKLYGACSRIAKEMGYKKIITYILSSETGISLIASGWKKEADNVGKLFWNSSKTITRTTEMIDLFGTTKKYPQEKKARWAKQLKLIINN